MTAANTSVSERVLAVLADGPATAREIGDQIGFPALSLRQILTDLEKHGKVQSDKEWLRGRASTWRLVA